MMLLAYELLARCKHLQLAGVDEYGELQWIGLGEDWAEVTRDEMNVIWG